MSMQQETRFQCDRCRIVVNVAHNDQPALDRGKPPGSWIVLYLHNPTSPAVHLCSLCAPKFETFMNEGVAVS